MTQSTHSVLSHIDNHGKANMVDVSEKAASTRMAIAEAFVSVSDIALEQIIENQLAKGDVFSVARVAGIQAAKQCADLVPLCHPLLLSKVDIDFETDELSRQIKITCQCKLNGNTGVEMEALTGVSIAALTLFDMCKAVDPEMVIHGLKVTEKSGGKTGLWRRSA
ncbi:cyclic pyranopterin monophosphate synthase MoaC [Aestuariibacter salexigens]|uniref:cyclic pyranopterin monophosphate synthase MoaC n=1 Tax=Aestuariibacter salexigens TaxID=226010 RepID=UPI00041560F3|nr:cyclic pyranopterin monophosphate synthase MoaC [Aestuariibacter salexigens]